MQRKAPECFYYQKETSVTAEDYSHEMGGTLDIQKLTHHEPCWSKVLPKQTIEKRPRTLIFAEYANVSYHDESIAEVIATLSWLKRANFTIYFFFSGEYIPFNVDSIAWLAHALTYGLHTIESAEKCLNDVAKQLDIPVNQLFVVDHYWLSNVNQNGHVAPHRVLDSRQLEHRTVSEIVAVYAKQAAPVGQIVITHSNYTEPALRKELKEKLPNMSVKTDYQHIMLRGKNLATLRKSEQITVDSGDNSRIVTLQQLNKVQYVTIYNAEDTNQRDLLAVFGVNLTLSFKLIEHLILKRISTTENKFTIIEIKIDSKKRDIDLDLLLEHPEIRGLGIAHASSLHMPTFKAPGMLPNLKTIHLWQCQFEAADCYELFSQAPNLQTFYTTNSYLSLRKQKLYPVLTHSKLEYLTAYHSPEVGDFLGSTLSFPNALSIDNIPLENAKALPKRLCDLTLTQPNEATCKIVSTSRHITVLNLRGGNNKHANKQLLESNFPLTSLNISECLLPTEIAFGPRTQSQLQRIELTKFRMQRGLLANILRLASNLTCIHINDCHLEGELELEKILPKMLALEIYKSKLSNSTINTLLAALPNVTTLDVRDTPIASITLPAGSLNQLQALSMSDSYQASVISALLRAAPNLTTNVQIQHKLLSASEIEALRRNQTQDTNIFLPQKNPDTIRVDANTDPNAFNEPMQAKRIFYPLKGAAMPSVSRYRLEIYTDLVINNHPCDQEDAFRLIKPTEAELALVPCEAKQVAVDTMGLKAQIVDREGYDLFYARQDIELTFEWQALPSLLPKEKLTHYHLLSETDAEVYYSNRVHQYFIRALSTHAKTTIDFIVYVPNQSTPKPRHLSNKVAHYKAFGEHQLKLPRTKSTGHEYLAAINAQQVGACRHRAVSFKDAMNKEYPQHATDIIDNEIHMFAQSESNDEWHLCNLGGYDADLRIKEVDISTPNQAAAPIPEDRPRKLRKVEVNPFEAPLETWHSVKLNISNVKDYCAHLLNGERSSRLIEFKNSESLAALSVILTAYARSKHIPLYTIDKPYRLICSAPSIVSSGNKGELKRGPSGQFHQFLTTQAKSIVVVHYDAFTEGDAVRFNALIDDKRFADGTPIPTDTIIIGLTDTSNRYRYQGEDLTSRFQAKEICPLSDTMLQTAVSPLPILTGESTVATTNINLYHANDWQILLLGHWIFENDNLFFLENALQQALANNHRVISLENSQMDHPQVKHFWQQAFARGYIRYGGREIPIPADLQFIQQEGYAWLSLTGNVECIDTLISGAEVVNPELLTSIFYRYACNNQTQTLNSQKSLIEMNQHARLTLNVTHSLSDDAWGRLLTEAKRWHVTLTLGFAPTVEIPAYLKPRLRAAQSAPSVEIPSHTTIIVSEDQDLTLANLTQSNDWICIDVSELNVHQLITTITADFNEKIPRFYFQRVDRAVKHALDANQKVVLTGRFSAGLKQAIAPFLLNRALDSNARGKLVLITPDATGFEYFKTTIDNVNLADKQAYIDYPLSQADLAMESLAVLRARMRYRQAFGEAADTNNAWEGLESLNIALSFTLPDLENSAAISQAFQEQRYQQVMSVLKYAPYVYLTGITGVAKTTFVKQVFIEPHFTLFQGLAHLLDYAKSLAPNKVLFIDEVNLIDSDMSMFEGLMFNPPGLLIKGDFYPLRPGDKVIFASNPANYSLDRQLAPIFKRHGNVVLFTPLPQEYIFHVIMKPIFADLVPTPMLHNIAHELLRLYRFVCESSYDAILMSPREIEMISLMVLSYVNRHPNADVIAVTRFYGYQLTNGLIPEERREAYQAAFAPTNDLPMDAPLPTVSTSFAITKSREARVREIYDLVALRELRIHPDCNDSQRYGGLHAVIWEGEPGIGKSELAVLLLAQNGYREASIADVQDLETESARQAIIKAGPQKIYYRVPVSMQKADKERIFAFAFHQGAAICEDEPNSANMIEELRNEIFTAYYRGQRPINPGFLYIGTQNPASYGGRLTASNALARRVMTTTIPEYTAPEMLAILCKKGVPVEIATLMVSAYEKKVQEAKEKHLKPKPTFRDLIRVATDYLAKQQTSMYASSSTLFSAPNVHDHKRGRSQVLLPKQASIV